MHEEESKVLCLELFSITPGEPRTEAEEEEKTDMNKKGPATRVKSVVSAPNSPLRPHGGYMNGEARVRGGAQTLIPRALNMP